MDGWMDLSVIFLSFLCIFKHICININIFTLWSYGHFLDKPDYWHKHFASPNKERWDYYSVYKMGKEDEDIQLRLD